MCVCVCVCVCVGGSSPNIKSNTKLLGDVGGEGTPYDTDIIGIILMLYDTEYSLSRSTISSLTCIASLYDTDITGIIATGEIMAFYIDHPNSYKRTPPTYK